MRSIAVSWLLVLLLCASMAQATPRPRVCKAVGIKSLNEYVSQSGRKCFTTSAKAEAKGYTPFIKRAIGYSFYLDGGQIVPPNTVTTATGHCLLVQNSEETELGIKCTHSVTGTTAVHIHQAATGATGEIECDFGNPGDVSLSGFCSLSESGLQALKAGELYLDIHSGTYPAGEIRGQIDNDASQ